MSDLAFHGERNHVCPASRSKHAAVIGYAEKFCRVQRRQSYRLLQLPAGEIHDVADSVVQSQDASGQFTLMLTAITLYLHLKAAERVSSVGHSGGADCIRDQDRALIAFGAKEQPDYAWVHMNAVGNDVRREPVVFKNRAQNSRVAMIERAHGVEGMCGMIGPGSDPCFGFSVCG